MEEKLQLYIFMLLIHVSVALWQRVTVIKGQTVDLSCPITKAYQTNVEWKNPEGYIMFYKHTTALVSEVFKSKHYSLNKLSESEFIVSISDVTFKHGGNYTCSHYGNHVTDKTVELTVLDYPKITKTKHEGMFDIKCTAEGNHYPPQIFWKLDNGPEIVAHSQVLHEDKKYISRAMLRIKTMENGVTVKCLVRHPALHTQPLLDFVRIRQNSKKSQHTTSSPTAQPQGSTEVQRTTTGWLKHGRTTVYLTTRGSTRKTSDNASSTTGWTSVPATEEIMSNNHTEGNRTGTLNDPKTHTGSEGSSLLVFLVTCLIFGLMVVVIFVAMKLRRAHIAWKRENEDSDPSEESSKSKSSQEERNAQGQRRRGLFNTAFTQYINEEPPVINSAMNTAAIAATDSVNKEQASQPQTLRQTTAQSGTKETEL